MTPRDSIRILQVVGGMDRAGTETWLMHLLRNIDRRRFHMDFLVNTDRRYPYQEEIESLGSRLHVCPSPANPLRYARNLARILREHGPYDVVHTHIHHFSGLALGMAKAACVRTRIAHSHSDTTGPDSRSSLLRRLYLRIACLSIRRNASLKVAVSGPAAACLFGREWRSDAAASVVYCGLDFTAFRAPVDRAAIRRELGFAPDELVIGHVGRFELQKNHDLLLRIHAEVLKLRPEARLLMIGEGSLQGAARATAARLGIAGRVRFAGARPDVPRLMLGVMDVFLMPSSWEGLGLAAVEAQAAGLPVILSDQVPAEADVDCGLTRFIGVDEPAGAWASQILQHLNQARMPQADALRRVSRSQFNMERNVRALCQLYSSSLCPPIQ
jgi:glycosyltransferase involved in cell wall biosynthesis